MAKVLWQWKRARESFWHGQQKRAESAPLTSLQSQSCPTLWPRGLQHTRLPWPSPTLGACSNSCPSSQWCIQPSHPLLSPSPPAFNLSQHQGLFQSVIHIRWPKYWSFSFSISLFNDYSGLLSFRINWLDFFAVQGTLKSLLQHHSSKASVLWCLAFFIVQLSHPFMTTGNTVALTRWTFVGKVMSLPFNMLSRLVLAFLPRSKCLLISWLQSPSAVILEPPKIKTITVSTVLHLFAMKWWDWMPWPWFFECCFKSAFSLSSFTFIKRCFSSSSLSAMKRWSQMPWY